MGQGTKEENITVDVIKNVENLLELHRCDTLCMHGTRTSVLKSCGDCENGMNLNDSESNSKVKYNADINKLLLLTGKM